ncbi:MAG: hypothetical protein ACLQVF_12595 [Isosphaeraceae bacterium]
MRVQARWALGLCGLVLAFPAWVAAGPVDGDQPAPVANGYQPTPVAGSDQPAPMANGYQLAPMANGYQPAPMANSYQTAAMASNNEVPPVHNHKGLFGRRHCVECQRAYAKRHYGVDVPPPPSFAPGVAMQGQVVTAPGARCAACEASVVSGSVVAADPHAPGYTVVGGPTAMAGEAPGYAVAGGNVAMSGAPGYAVVGGAATGAEPSPIGVARSMQPQWANPRMAAYGARPGALGYDPSVTPSSIPPAQDALASPGHDRPHIVRHILGLPTFGAHRREQEEKARAKHAAIAYDQPNTTVTELPASMVYGTKGH